MGPGSAVCRAGSIRRCQPDARTSGRHRLTRPDGSPAAGPLARTPVPDPAEREPMTHPPTSHPVDPPTRRAVGRGVVGGLAALAVAPALAGPAQAAAAEKKKP